MKLSLKKNIFYLYINQILTYLFPLITLPVLVDRLGTNGFGKYSFSLALVGYFLLIVDYGFNISASRKIAQHKFDDSIKTEIFLYTIFAKIILVLTSAFLLTLVTLSIPRINENLELNWLIFISSIGLALFPQWYFQGVERMGNITIINTISKTSYTILILVFVKNTTDLNLAGFFYGISFLIPGILAFYIAFRELKFNIIHYFKRVSQKALWIKSILHSAINELIDGRHIFLSTILSSVLISTSVFLLGIFQTDAIVGGYAANDKLIKAVLLMFAPITNAIYPNISYELSISEKDGIKSIKKYAIPIVLLSTVISLFLILFNQNILGFFFNTEILEYKSAFTILAIWIPVSVLNNFIGIQYLCGSGKSKLYGKSFTVSGLITLLVMIFASKYYSFNGTALAVIFGEILLTVMMVINIKKHK